MNQTVRDYLNKHTQYKPRLDTDILFPYGSDFSYSGIVNDMATFVQERQLKDVRMWQRFVDVYRSDCDGESRSWRGEFFGKMMRGACITYRYTKDKELYRILEDVIKDMLTAQDELGRYSTYSTENEFNGWDLWCRKYVLLGFLHFHEICKCDKLKNEIIESAKKHLDYIIERIGPEEEGKKPITETSWNWGAINSASILEPTLRLYNITGEKKYFDFGEYIVNIGACRDGDIFTMAYENKIAPFQYPVVKAYEMMSCFEGLIEYYRITKIEKWKQAAINFANAVIETDITLPGSCGCTHELFDNSALMQTLTGVRGRMQETCVTVTWMKFLTHILCLTGDPKYAEEIEKSAFNALYGAVNTADSPKNGGLTFDSYSPLLKFYRGNAIGGLMSLWTAIYGCCNAIGAAGTGFVPQFTLFQDKDGVVFNTYAPGEIYTVTPSDNPLYMDVETEYPKGDSISVIVTPEQAETFTVKMRIPSFAKSATLSVEGESFTALPGTYAEITRAWNPGDEIQLNLEIVPEIIFAKPNPKDENAQKHVAIKRGALVLARDTDITPDVGEVLDFDKKITLREIHSLDVESQCQYLVSTDKGCATLMVDYASAGKGVEPPEMECWFPTEEFKTENIEII
ncbi:MAG: glycoside hydrolase family 127 protein [Clostridia bacterium]|nr:glycoside hydrolase family 127 protein [Clostridia bacterium]